MFFYSKILWNIYFTTVKIGKQVAVKGCFNFTSTYHRNSLFKLSVQVTHVLHNLSIINENVNIFSDMIYYFTTHIVRSHISVRLILWISLFVASCLQLTQFINRVLLNYIRINKIQDLSCHNACNWSCLKLVFCAFSIYKNTYFNCLIFQTIV